MSTTMSRSQGGRRDLYSSSNKENNHKRLQNVLSQSKPLLDDDDDGGHVVNETAEESSCTCKIDIIKQVASTRATRGPTQWAQYLPK